MKALAGVRVIEMGSVVLAPYAGQLLADLGATVVKVEPLAGDTTRNLGHAAHPDMAALFLNCNRGKQSIAIDVAKADGLAVLKRLVASADVFLHNMHFDSAERLGIGHAKLAEVHCRGQRATWGQAAQTLARMLHRMAFGLALRDRIVER